jgi:hypothetical protein
MEMFFFMNFVTSMIFLLACGSDTPADPVSLIPARDYFQLHNIDVNVDKMAALAAKAPTDAQESVAQLLAIRWLGEHAAEVKKTKGVRDTLQKIAEGKTGKDALGFAKDHARRALARIDGKEPPVRTLSDNSVRTSALEWFPKNSSMFGALDFRPARAVEAEETNSLRMFVAAMTGMIHERQRKEMYGFVDKVGNIRVDRISFAVIPDKNQDRETRLYMRATGLVDRKRLAAFIQANMGKGEVKEQKGPNDEPITIIDLKNEGPSMAIIDNTDFIVAGYPGSPRRDDHVRVIEEMLQIRAGKQPSLVKGNYAGTLKNIPAQAQGLLIGDLPEHWRGELTGRHSPFRGMPQDFNLSWIRTAKGLEFRFTGNCASGKEAKAFVESVDHLRQEGIEGLKKLPNQMKVKPKTVENLTAALKGIKLEAQDTLLAGKATFSKDAINALSDLMQAALSLMMRPVRGELPAKPREK